MGKSAFVDKSRKQKNSGVSARLAAQTAPRARPVWKGAKPTIGTAECHAILAEWLTNPAKPEYVQQKINLPEFQHGCGSLSRKECGSKSTRTQQIGYALKFGVLPTRSVFLRGYLDLQARKTPLLDIACAVERHPANPASAFGLLLESLAAWDPNQHPIAAKYQSRTAATNSTGNILPTIKQLKVPIDN